MKSQVFQRNISKLQASKFSFSFCHYARDLNQPGTAEWKQKSNMVPHEVKSYDQ